MEDASFKMFTTDFGNRLWVEIEDLPEGTYFKEMEFEGEFRVGIDNDGVLWYWDKDQEEDTYKIKKFEYFVEHSLKVLKVRVGEHHLVA